MMPILATKFYRPRPRPDTILRPRLLQQVAAGLSRPVVLLTAPAGFGKTTLLAQWQESAAGQAVPLAWLSLETEECDPHRFLDCLAAAIAPLQPGLREAETAVAPTQPLPPQVRLNGLLQALTPDAPFALVLEDYHTITAGAVHALVSYLIQHLPPTMHLILSSRSEPPLPLARLRVRGDLAEIRVDELRFTAEESAAYLQQALAVPLAAADIQTLTERTEGWIAGLKLAVLSLQNRSYPDLTTFVAHFNGSHRYIADYLLEEVLNQQPAAVRTFLLQTAVLSMLCGPLCDALTGQQHGQAMLEHLDQQNLFLVRLDDERCWFRYHHLFADLLRQRLDQFYPGLAAELHRRAVAWYTENELVACAIDEALDAGEFTIAADLIERAGPELLAAGQQALLTRWLHALPTAFGQQQRGLRALRAAVSEPLLTPREQEVVRLLSQGATNRQIAQTLVVSLGTVKKHLNNIFLKLSAQSRTQAVARARELGLV